MSRTKFEKLSISYHKMIGYKGNKVQPLLIFVGKKINTKFKD